MDGSVKVPFIDLVELHAPLEEDLMAAVREVIQSGRFILGPKVTELETWVADLTGAKHAVGVSSGTDALLAALMGLDVGPGDTVITTDFSFAATAEVIARLGARPRFVDIEADGFNLDVDQVAVALDDTVKAVVPVHLFGRMADMRRLVDLCGDVPVIEDAAQALGASRDGLKAGSAGTMGCISFFPTKNLGGLGDGGMVTTNDRALEETLRVVRAHGGRTKDRHERLGGNFRLDALHAALLLVKAPHLAQWTEQRRRNARLYQELFEGKTLPVTLPTPDRDDDLSVWNQFVISVPGRDELRRYLASRGVPSLVYYATPFHLEPCFASLGHRVGDFPRAELAAGRVLALPIHPGLRGEQIEYVVKCVAQFYEQEFSGS
ncbi:MAG: DegT/DnrJ/EryC1/StrS family aminotransferase [Deltaproteobacteria bacterium]|nr:DegT/DnrJ/EryC1/StrS family aminotransferase [Deltaproteobacteria bacterium]